MAWNWNHWEDQNHQIKRNRTASNLVSSEQSLISILFPRCCLFYFTFCVGCNTFEQSRLKPHKCIYLLTLHSMPTLRHRIQHKSIFIMLLTIKGFDSNVLIEFSVDRTNERLATKLCIHIYIWHIRGFFHCALP